jgi:hypothetical protein
MIKHIDAAWFAFGRGLGLGINQMEDIILVTVVISRNHGSKSCSPSAGGTHGRHLMFRYLVMVMLLSNSSTRAEGI